jgi:predicted lysophospholipase L1 biosynthesis ABC-type transport system permease subunit
MILCSQKRLFALFLSGMAAGYALLHAAIAIWGKLPVQIFSFPLTAHLNLLCCMVSIAACIGLALVACCCKKACAAPGDTIATRCCKK